jgi:hypothetical protein
VNGFHASQNACMHKARMSATWTVAAPAPGFRVTPIGNQAADPNGQQVDTHCGVIPADMHVVGHPSHYAPGFNATRLSAILPRHPPPPKNIPTNSIEVPHHPQKRQVPRVGPAAGLQRTPCDNQPPTPHTQAPKQPVTRGCECCPVVLGALRLYHAGSNHRLKRKHIQTRANPITGTTYGVVNHPQGCQPHTGRDLQNARHAASMSTHDTAAAQTLR